MKKTLFLLVLVVLAVSSCATARYYGGFTPENARHDMALMGPVSSIYYLDENYNESFNDTLSIISETLITRLVDEMGVPVSGRIELNDDEKEEAFAFLRYLYERDWETLDTFPIPDLLDKALEAQGYRYGLVLVARGMTRDAKEYAKEVALNVLVDVALTVLIPGTAVVPIPSDSCYSQISAAVLDSETDRIVFYNATVPKEKNPLRSGTVQKQLNKLLKDFLR